MFVVCRKLPGDQRWCILVCQSERTGSKVSQKTVKYFGVAHGEEQRKIVVEQAKQEISILQTNNKQQSAKLSPNSPSVKVIEYCDGALLGNLVEIRRTTEGFHDVLGPVFDSLLLKPLLTKIRYNQLKDVVIARIAEPASKLRTAKILQNTFYKQLSDDQIYRLMDEIVDLEDAIKTKIFDATKCTLGCQSIELLLFDVTTLYFESQKRDELREFGYSKDHKIGETQVVLALATTPGGFPIGYHLFQGNTAETSTLLQCLKKWGESFDISRVIVVADRAMMSDANLLMMEDNNMTYVVAAKLKSLPKALKTQILERKQEISTDLLGECINIQEYNHKSRRLVVQYSDNRAKKDASDRERLVEKVQNLQPSVF
jgi:transposase